MIDQARIDALGDMLFEAQRTRQPIDKIAALEPTCTIEDAYRIQSRMMDRRIADGEKVIGKKIGLTSKAIQDALGVYQPDFGILTDAMLFQDGDTIDLGTLMQPRVEGELAFVLKHDVNGPGVTALDVLQATAYVTPCIEVVDTRFQDWKIAIQDTVSDNASCGVFVLGREKTDPRDVDLRLAGMVVCKNDEVATSGCGAAVQGSPLNAVAWLANTLGPLGKPLKAGEVILSGSQAALVGMQGGDTLSVEIAGMGKCNVHFTGKALA
ncbi:fumarylacetoacetate hydrolase family protein [Marivivens niveibacter]|uniref:fumarylacetoacetate hydrolase family protein n=1 Tax=Marivivens niveibacter TaxID=1930667 RepID=UPI001F0ADF10|nr:fumarylacetoacetate hydrolase family protein [Marivivens niveibacter]